MSPLASQPFVVPDWRRARDYEALLIADRCSFAWEWVRRSGAYRQAWLSRHTDAADPRTYGLVRYEDPSLTIPQARPIWCAHIDTSTIQAKVLEFRAALADRVDLLDLRPFLTLAIDNEDIEHLLISDGLRFLRIDVLEGTLIGCPAVLRCLVDGIASLKAPLSSIERLIRLRQSGVLYPVRHRPGRLPLRWIAELRVADALAEDVDQQEIARTLYQGLVPDEQWRKDNEATRTRTQRLVRAARHRLGSPLDPIWFALD